VNHARSPSVRLFFIGDRDFKHLKHLKHLIKKPPKQKTEDIKEKRMAEYRIERIRYSKSEGR